MKRRVVLTSLGALGILGGGVYFSRRRGQESTSGEDLLARKIRERLPMLEIPDEVLGHFVTDHEAAKGAFRGRKVSRDLVQQFLFSTDFFPDANEAKALVYKGYYDPYGIPCRNPFWKAR